MMAIKIVSVFKPLSLWTLATTILFNSSSAQTTNTWEVIPTHTSWQWQLEGDINTDYAVDLYDIDLFEAPESVITTLQQSGKKVICYFSAGTTESWRDDSDQFPPPTIGKALQNWPGERWLDIRRPAIREIMQKRLDFAAARQCDGVEPDNINAFENDNGLGLSYDDQLDYNRWLANEAHQRELAIGLKTDFSQAHALVDVYDFAISEQCFEFDECALLLPFINANKAVLNTEYDQRYIDDMAYRETMCQQSEALGFQTLILPLELDDRFRIACADHNGK